MSINKNYIILSVDTEKALGKFNPHSLKNSQYSKKRGELLKLIKSIYKKNTANLMTNGKKKTEYIPSNIRNKIRMFTPITFIQLLLEVLATGIKQSKKKEER